MHAADKARLGLAIVCLGALVGPFDTAVNTAFPVITADFRLALREIQWVVIAFVLAQSSVALVFGRLGDLFGHRRVFAFGMLASVLAHLGAGFAPDFASLVAMRVLQGIAVGMAISCAPALATLLFPAAAKRQVLAIYVTATSLALALGPWLGGLLIGVFGWPGVFWFRVPLSLLALLMLPWLPVVALPGAAPGLVQGAVPGATPASRPTLRAQLARIDWLGAFGLAAVLSCVVLSLAEATRPQGQALHAGALMALGLVGGWLLVAHESHTAQPVLRMSPFRSGRFSGVQAASVAVNFACFGNLLLLPYVLSREAGMPIAAVGLALSMYPAGSMLSAMLAARLGARLSSRDLMVLGLFGAAVGLLATALLLRVSGGASLAVGMLLCGLGQGLFQVGYMDSTTSMLPPHERGVAGSLVSVTRLLGIVLGATLISWLHGLWQQFWFSFTLLGGGLAATAVVFALGLRGARLDQPIE